MDARKQMITVGRFVIDPVPNSKHGWVRWWFRFIFCHIPARVAMLAQILVSTTCITTAPQVIGKTQHVREQMKREDPSPFVDNPRSLFQHINRVFTTWE